MTVNKDHVTGTKLVLLLIIEKFPASARDHKTQIGYQILPSACVRLYGLQTADLLQVQKRGPCKSGRCIQDTGRINGRCIGKQYLFCALHGFSRTVIFFFHIRRPPFFVSAYSASTAQMRSTS